MKPPTVVLLNLHTSDELTTQLDEILSSDFKVITQQLPIDPQDLPNDEVDNAAATPVHKYDLIFAILSPRTEPNLVVRTIRQAVGEAPFIAVVEEAEPEEMFELLKLGAADYITVPLKAVDILPRLWRVLETSREHENVVYALKGKLGLRQLVGKSPAFLREMEKIPLVAKCEAVILISGETGTGKELYARAIHHLSPRADKPFIPVNCGAIPAELVENELFGHERGAFTGAHNSERGLVVEAEGGTIFLDEIDCLPVLAQTKLLRFLQEKEYRPLGSAKMRKADVRVIAASNVDFDEAVATGKLRRDLYYRLNVIRLVLPPLRERREDIPLLVQYFLAKYASEFVRDVPVIMDETMEMLMIYDWPGNVRELEHVIERAVVLSSKGAVSQKDIDLPGVAKTSSHEAFRTAKASVIEQFEKVYIQRLLVTHRGNITRAAQAAHKNRRAFWQLIRKHQIQVQSFKSYVS